MISAAERLGKEIKIKRSRNQRREIMSVKIALAGNPNCGKTTLFNALTGSNQFVGNWPGVTVEKKEGKLKGHKDVILTYLVFILYHHIHLKR